MKKMNSKKFLATVLTTALVAITLLIQPTSAHAGIGTGPSDDNYIPFGPTGMADDAVIDNTGWNPSFATTYVPTVADEAHWALIDQVQPMVQLYHLSKGTFVMPWRSLEPGEYQVHMIVNSGTDLRNFKMKLNQKRTNSVLTLDWQITGTVGASKKLAERTKFIQYGSMNFGIQSSQAFYMSDQIGIQGTQAPFYDTRFVGNMARWQPFGSDTSRSGRIKANGAVSVTVTFLIN